MRIFILHKKHRSQKKKVGSLFQPVIDEELHNLRRWKNEDWRGKSAKGWCSATANPMIKAYKRVTPHATQDFVSFMSHAIAGHCVGQDIQRYKSENVVTWLSLSNCIHQKQHFGSLLTSSLARQTNSGKKQTYRYSCWQCARLARSFISSLGVCEAWQPISARTPEATLISSHRSCLCAVCFSAKECQVRLSWPSSGPVLSQPSPTPWGSQRQAPPPAMRVTLG